MPLIPTYTASASGVLNPTGETCGDDPTLTEVGLDFSMMAPLPHDQQRPGAVGAGLTDLLGIAPGASYRLVVPSTPGGAVSIVDAAFAAAATQTPRPDVITASLGFAYDQFGFASRYLEEDPMTEAVLASIDRSRIVVCGSGGHRLPTFANAGSVVNEGGTSASAPETAAAAAVVLQVARLTHDHQLTNNPLAVRAFLASSGTDLPAVPQSDTSLNVGPQIDVGHAVELLLAPRGQPATPGVARVAVVQRRQASALRRTRMTATDPTRNAQTGRLPNPGITSAPDCTGATHDGL